VVDVIAHEWCCHVNVKNKLTYASIHPLETPQILDHIISVFECLGNLTVIRWKCTKEITWNLEVGLTVYKNFRNIYIYMNIANDM